MDASSSSDKDYSTIKDGRGEIKVYSSPAKEAPKEDLTSSSMPEQKKEKRTRRKVTSLFLRILGCWVPILLLFLFIAFLISKPPIIWNGVADFINNDVSVDPISPLTEEEALQQINSQLKTVGENTIRINETQLTALLSPRLTQLKNLVVDLEDGTIKLIWTLDDNSNGKDIYGIIELVYKEGELKIQRIGTGRIYLPESLNETITSSILSITQMSNNSTTSNLMQIVLPFESGLEIKSLDINKDEIVIVSSIDASLFQ